MKRIHKVSIFLLGLTGLFSASGALARAAEVQPQGNVQTSVGQPTIDSTLAADLTVEEQSVINQAIADLRAQYGDDVLNHSTFTIENGTVKLLSTDLSSVEMSRGSPSSG